MAAKDFLEEYSQARDAVMKMPLKYLGVTKFTMELNRNSDLLNFLVKKLNLNEYEQRKIEMSRYGGGEPHVKFADYINRQKICMDDIIEASRVIENHDACSFLTKLKQHQGVSNTNGIEKSDLTELSQYLYYDPRNPITRLTSWERLAEELDLPDIIDDIRTTKTQRGEYSGGDAFIEVLKLQGKKIQFLSQYLKTDFGSDAPSMMSMSSIYDACVETKISKEIKRRAKSERDVNVLENRSRVHNRTCEMNTYSKERKGKKKRKKTHSTLESVMHRLHIKDVKGGNRSKDHSVLLDMIENSVASRDILMQRREKTFKTTVNIYFSVQVVRKTYILGYFPRKEFKLKDADCDLDSQLFHNIADSIHSTFDSEMEQRFPLLASEACLVRVNPPVLSDQGDSISFQLVLDMSDGTPIPKKYWYPGTRYSIELWKRLKPAITEAAKFKDFETNVTLKDWTLGSIIITVSIIKNVNSLWTKEEVNDFLDRADLALRHIKISSDLPLKYISILPHNFLNLQIEIISLNEEVIEAVGSFLHSFKRKLLNHAVNGDPDFRIEADLANLGGKQQQAKLTQSDNILIHFEYEEYNIDNLKANDKNSEASDVLESTSPILDKDSQESNQDSVVEAAKQPEQEVDDDEGRSSMEEVEMKVSDSEMQTSDQEEESDVNEPEDNPQQDINMDDTETEEKVEQHSSVAVLGDKSMPNEDIDIVQEEVSVLLSTPSAPPYEGSHMSLPASQVYISTVKQLEKQLERGTLKYIVRNTLGIPFALLYGFVLYLILRHMIFSDSHQYVKPFNMTNLLHVDRDICSPNATHYTNKPRYHGNNASTSSSSSTTRTNGRVQHHFRGEHRDELAYTTAVGTVVVGVTSVFSRNTRSTMLLIFPVLITSRSRTLLFTFVLGLLCNGPMSSLQYNFDSMLENAACMYESALRASCQNSGLFNQIFEPFKALLMQFEKFVDSFKNMFKDIATVNADIKINPNITWPEFTDLINAPPMTEIKQQFSMVINKTTDILKYTHLCGKLLTVISIILMINDVVRYIRRYYSDSSFENMFVTDDVKKLWKERGYQILTPLRHWEINDGFKVSNSPKCTKRELYKSVRHFLLTSYSVPTLIFSILSIILIFADIRLAAALKYIKEKDNLNIFFEGMQQNYTEKLELNLAAYNISASQCLSEPVYTSRNVYIIVSLVLFTAGVSCILEVYMSRVRARMCNLFYPDKAMERADYLHYRLSIGRISRKYQLMLIVRGELERRGKLLRFSPLARLKKFLSGCAKLKPLDRRTFVCPGCGWKQRSVKARGINFCLGERAVDDNICRDCHLDLKGGREIDERNLLFNMSAGSEGSPNDSPYLL